VTTTELATIRAIAKYLDDCAASARNSGRGDDTTNYTLGLCIARMSIAANDLRDLVTLNTDALPVEAHTEQGPA
jgi:hypothetical protein